MTDRRRSQAVTPWWFLADQEKVLPILELRTVM
jgi:hypothetical protein